MSSSSSSSSSSIAAAHSVGGGSGALLDAGMFGGGVNFYNSVVTPVVAATNYGSVPSANHATTTTTTFMQPASSNFGATQSLAPSTGVGDGGGKIKSMPIAKQLASGSSGAPIVALDGHSSSNIAGVVNGGANGNGVGGQLSMSAFLAAMQRAALTADGTPAYAVAGSPYAHMTPEQYRNFYAIYQTRYSSALASLNEPLTPPVLASISAAAAAAAAAIVSQQPPPQQQ